MKEYEEHLEDLSRISEGILGGIGNALKGFAQGVSGEPYGTEDANKENPKIHKTGLGNYLKGGASEKMTGAFNKMKKQKAGVQSGFQIGHNTIENVSEDLRVILFKLDENGDYQPNYDFDGDPYKLRWLLDGTYQASQLGLASRNTGGPVKGKHVTFKGVWKGGEFRGVMLSPSTILGGYINDGYYLSLPDGFKIPPYNFIKGGYSTTKEFVMGMRLAKENQSYKKLSLVQVPKNNQIKIIDNNDKEHLLSVSKGVDYTSLNLTINGVEVPWENYNRTKEKFLTSIMEVGNKFSIPNIIDIPAGIQSIEVKASSYESKDTGETNVGDNKYKFVITEPKGWGWASGYSLDKSAVDDENVKKQIDRFKEDIESGSFFRYLRFFKKLIEQNRIDGYGKFPALSYLYPEQVGTKGNQKDEKRDATMKYFSDFSENVIDNLTSEKIAKFYENKIKKELGLEVAKNKVVAKGTGTATGGRKSQALSLSENKSKLLLAPILKEIIKK